MTDKFVTELTNERELRQRIGNAVASLQRPRELLDRIGRVLHDNINLRFDTKTAPDGTRWLPISAKTRALYDKKYDGNIPGSLLLRTGDHMRQLLTYNAGDDFAEVGFSGPVALYHEFGTHRGLPRRQLLTDDPIAGTLGADDRQDVYDEIAAFLQAL